MAETITIGPITFIVAPEETSKPKPAPKPQPKRTRRPSAPLCTASRDTCTMPPSVRCSDGIYRMNYQAAEFERKKNKRWWQRG